MNTETAVKSRLAEVVEARTNLREAVQTSDMASVIWWEKELRLRQSVMRWWQDRSECGGL
jgi:hypothetical protein